MFLVVLGHPTPHSQSDALAEAYVRGLRSRGAEVEILTLRELEFDPNLRAGFSGAQELEADLLRAQDSFTRAHHVAWFFPTWWAGPPALVKAFIDRAFLPGFAFAYRKNSALPETLLSGRSSRVVTTMDSPAFWYQLWHRSSVHTSFVNATLRFVGMGPIVTTTIYKQKWLDERERTKWMTRLEEQGQKDAARFAESEERRRSKREVVRLSA